MAEIIDLFTRERTPTDPEPEVWKWAEENAADFTLNMQAIVEDLTHATTEHAFMAAIAEIKAEVEKIP